MRFVHGGISRGPHCECFSGLAVGPTAVASAQTLTEPMESRGTFTVGAWQCPPPIRAVSPYHGVDASAPCIQPPESLGLQDFDADLLFNGESPISGIIQNLPRVGWSTGPSSEVLSRIRDPHVVASYRELFAGNSAVSLACLHTALGQATVCGFDSLK